VTTVWVFVVILFVLVIALFFFVSRRWVTSRWCPRLTSRSA